MTAFVYAPSKAQGVGGYYRYSGPDAGADDGSTGYFGPLPLTDYRERPGLEVPYNWHDEVPRFLGKINEQEDTRYPVKEVYMADKRSVTGSGRPACALGGRKRPYRDYVDEFHAYGIRLKYVLNGTFHGGRELSDKMQSEVLDLVEELVEAGFDSVTVATPLLALVIHDHFPDLHLSTSVNNHVDSCDRVRDLFSYVPYGTIMLDNRHSRNFPLMRRLREEFPEYELTVLANESCLKSCSLQPHHQDLLANMSRSGGLGDTSLDYCHLLCAKRKLHDPVQAMKSPWIPPNYVHHLFEAGVNTVKIAGRTMGPAWIVHTACSYAAGRFDGYNVWPLIEKSGLTGSDWKHALGRDLSPCHYMVKNSELDGFFDPFVNGTAPCLRGPGGCADCGHCASWTSKAVEAPSNREQRLRDIEELMTVALKGTGDRKSTSHSNIREVA